MKTSAKAIRFLESLTISEGPKVGESFRLAPFQRKFVRGALADGIEIGILSLARGGGKSAISAGLGLGALLGEWDHQPRRDVVLAARTLQQARICWQFAVSFCLGLPDEVQEQLVFRRSPRLEIEFKGDGGGHVLRGVAADGKSALGLGPTFCVMDERAHWQPDRGDELEAALMTGLGKRSGRVLMISTSGADDACTFSRWIDHPPEATYVQQHMADPSLPVDDIRGILAANPGAKHGIGASVEWLQASARRAIQRGGNTLNSFRLFHLNQRVSGETRDVLLTTDQWLAAETDTLPPRSGPVVVGIDLGGSASMSAVSFYWTETGRLENYGTFPADPGLLDRGQADGVGDRYIRMQERGELTTLDGKTVPVAEWLASIWRRIEGEPVSALVADRYKAAELGEAITKAAITAPVIWRGMGWRDGGEDVERFQRAVFEGAVQTTESLLMRSAIADAVCLRDPANNLKLAKARSTGRIDAVAAAVLAVAEGARHRARPVRQARSPTWV